MKVITESFLRETFRKEIPETFVLERGQIMTPSARQLLNEKRVEIVTGTKEAVVKVSDRASDTFILQAAVQKFVSAGDGGIFETKPEHMTRLQGNRLVPKDHKRIIFRGRMESLRSDILIARLEAHEKGAKRLVSDFGEILELVKAVISADVDDETLLLNRLIGLDYKEIKEQCKDPEKYFGINHIKPDEIELDQIKSDLNMGKTLLGLNMLRTCIREVESLAVKAFRSEFELEKPDIISALNIMSSAVSLMMLREKTGKYL